MKQFLWRFHGGLHLEGRKELSNQVPIRPAPLPNYLILPLLQHIGEPTEPVVQIGDRVLKGQIIAHCHSNHDCSLLMSSPIHASSSGTVTAIEPRPVPHASGYSATCIIIETDGTDTWMPLQPLPHYSQMSPETVRRHVAMAGIVGLGGAGFPAHLKLKSTGIETLIINGAECEPYITCDDRLMQEFPQQIIEGALILSHALGGAKRCIIALEDNKPHAFHALTQVPQTQVEIIKVPTLYPTGGERQLIKVLTDKELGRSRIPSDLGIVVQNVETTRAVYRAVLKGRPLVSRVVTVTGNGIERPQNFEVLLGTPISLLLDACGRKTGLDQLIMGGPMMGLSLPTDELPVIKTSNCFIASNTGELVNNSLPTMPCIRCGSCAEACPINLLPQQLYWFSKGKDFTKLKQYHLFDCIECGCCAYVCPSHIPLVNYYRYAKAHIRTQERERKKADQALQRHEFKLFRLAREKTERRLRHQAAAQKNPPEGN